MPQVQSYSKTFIASALIGEGLCVVMDAAGTVSAASAAGDPIIGICEAGAAANEEAVVTVHGPVQATAAGVITRGTHNLLTSNAAGRVTPAGAGNSIVGFYLHPTANAAAADRVDIFVSIGIGT